MGNEGCDMSAGGPRKLVMRPGRVNVKWIGTSMLVSVSRATPLNTNPLRKDLAVRAVNLNSYWGRSGWLASVTS